MTAIPCTPLGHKQPPDWIRDIFTDKQLDLRPALLWCLLLDYCPMPPSTDHLARRYFVYADLKDAFDAWPSVRTLARQLKRSTSSVYRAQRQLVDLGFLWPAGRHEKPGLVEEHWPMEYLLAWPASSEVLDVEIVTRIVDETKVVRSPRARPDSGATDEGCIAGRYTPVSQGHTPPVSESDTGVYRRARRSSSSSSSVDSLSDFLIAQADAFEEEEQQERKEAEALFVADLARQGLTAPEIATALHNGRRAAS